MQTAYLIFNPYAGQFPSRMLTERAAADLSEHNWDIRFIQTCGGPEITDIAIDAVKENREKHFSSVSYGARTVRYASFGSSLNLHAIVDDKQISGRFIMTVTSNIHLHLYAGGMAEISPQTRLDDGIMDLWQFAGETVFEKVQHAWNLFSGWHLNSDQAGCLPFRNIRLFSDQILEIQLDDEPVAGAQEVKIEVHSKKLKILVPLEVPRFCLWRISYETQPI